MCDSEEFAEAGISPGSIAAVEEIAEHQREDELHFQLLLVDLSV